MADTDWQQPLSGVPGLSESLAQAFLRAGVGNVREALLHLPLRYEDRSHLSPVVALQDGQSALIHAQVMSQKVTYGRRKMLAVTLTDRAGDGFQLRYFHFYPNQLKQFQTGRWGVFYGKVSQSPHGFEMAHPEIEWLTEDQLPVLSDRLLPVYATVKGLSQGRWRNAMGKLLMRLDGAQQDPLTDLGYLPLAEALHLLHQPPVGESAVALLTDTHPARQRLLIEELCAHQLALQYARAELRAQNACPLPENATLVEQFVGQLPFVLTNAQQRVRREISADLTRSEPMLRLVQGDVGSGKTVIALLACLQAISAGKQAVFVAPTELLAEQHANNIERLLAGMDVCVVRLVSKLPAKEKRRCLQAIASGEAQLIVGTHAVFQAQVSYHDLALVAIDEQHRFGVHQRLMLREKTRDGLGVHQLVLTATPIPRTLAMSAYGELDTSIIDALPAGRKAIQTSVVAGERRDAVIERVGVVCREGRQAYWVCPLIEESDVLECENAEHTAEYLQAQLPDLRVALVHGRLPGEQRQQTMAAFAAGTIDLLVATTVIEVGVDVANASLMIIENAERFGLSQLHQLRGRVGRGEYQSYCLLLYQSPLGETAKRRLAIMRETTDGFRIAEEDLAIRGAGELLGTRQAGVVGFYLADLLRDGEQMHLAERYCARWQSDAPEFARQLVERWLGGKSRYLKV